MTTITNIDDLVHCRRQQDNNILQIVGVWELFRLKDEALSFNKNVTGRYQGQAHPLSRSLSSKKITERMLKISIMHIKINDTTSLREIQLVFSDFYPYLKLEFYRKRHNKYEASHESFLIDPNIYIGDIKHTHVSGMLEIRPLYKVADVEKEFQQRFGLSVQVFRKEKNGWQQTTGMDDFTLKELNGIGRNSLDEFIISDYAESFEEIEEKPVRLF